MRAKRVLCFNNGIWGGDKASKLYLTYQVAWAADRSKTVIMLIMHTCTRSLIRAFAEYSMSVKLRMY